MKLDRGKLKLLRKGKGKLGEEIPQLEQVASFKYLGSTLLEIKSCFCLVCGD